MLLKTISFLLLLQIAAIYGKDKFMIKNKKTGLVLNANQNPIGIGAWDNQNTQLWTLEPTASGGRYFLHNVGNGKVLDACPVTRAILTWNKHGNTNQQWSLQPNEGDTRIQVLFYPNDFLVHQDGKPKLHGSKQNDDSDIWLLVEPPK